jgi:hypothetical protein
MRKLSKIVMAAAVIMIIAAIVAACTTETPTPSESPKPDWMYTVGQDKVTVTAPGANQYAQTFNVNLKIVGGGGIELFNGVVTVTTNTQKLSEVIQAAVSDKGLAQNGIDVGFIASPELRRARVAGKDGRLEGTGKEVVEEHRLHVLIDMAGGDREVLHAIGGGRMQGGIRPELTDAQPHE